MCCYWAIETAGSTVRYTHHLFPSKKDLPFFGTAHVMVNRKPKHYKANEEGTHISKQPGCSISLLVPLYFCAGIEWKGRSLGPVSSLH